MCRWGSIQALLCRQKRATLLSARHPRRALPPRQSIWHHHLESPRSFRRRVRTLWILKRQPRVVMNCPSEPICATSRQGSLCGVAPSRLFSHYGRRWPIPRTKRCKSCGGDYLLDFFRHIANPQGEPRLDPRGATLSWSLYRLWGNREARRTHRSALAKEGYSRPSPTWGRSQKTRSD
jgi:hypothetical protein